MLCLCCRHPTSRQTSWIWTNTQTGSAAVVDLVLWVVLHSKSLPERVWHGCGLRLFTLYRAEGNNARKLPSLLKVIDSYLKTCHVDSCWKTCHVDSCWKTCQICSRPEVTQCSWLDITVQELTNLHIFTMLWSSYFGAIVIRPVLWSLKTNGSRDPVNKGKGLSSLGPLNTVVWAETWVKGLAFIQAVKKAAREE